MSSHESIVQQPSLVVLLFLFHTDLNTCSVQHLRHASIPVGAGSTQQCLEDAQSDNCREQRGPDSAATGCTVPCLLWDRTSAGREHVC